MEKLLKIVRQIRIIAYLLLLIGGFVMALTIVRSEDTKELNLYLFFLGNFCTSIGMYFLGASSAIYSCVKNFLS